MKENKYDEQVFFEKYQNMDRSQKGLAAAGEWETLRKMLPSFRGQRVLDLGCGFGWHCQYAVEKGALSVTGIDISKNMLAIARERNASEKIKYIQMPIEEIDFPENTFDIVISSLCFHYIESFEKLILQINKLLSLGGQLVFSAEHPVFTAYGTQDWIYDKDGTILYFPVDNYFREGVRNAIFLKEDVKKYHRSMTSYLSTLLQNGFTITNFAEPQPSEQMLTQIPEMENELRRPMMFIVCARKEA